MVDAHPDKVGHRRVLPLAQAGQAAAEHLICEEEEEEEAAVTPTGRSNMKQETLMSQSQSWMTYL